jgi:transposase-like protein
LTPSERREIVSQLRHGKSFRQVAKNFGVAKSTAERWWQHAQNERLDRVNWQTAKSKNFAPTNRTAAAVERCVLDWRKQLALTDDLGEFGADAIRRRMQENGCNQLPSRATVNRILARHDRLKKRGRRRHKSPPPGWYLPRVAQKIAEVDQFDYVLDLFITGGESFCVLNGVALHSGLVCSAPQTRTTAENVEKTLLSHWRQFGLPDYAQFDNGWCFAGQPRPDAIGRIARLCLRLGVTPVFVPPREPSFQAAIESYNGRWQKGVWQRFRFSTLAELQAQSKKYVAATRRKLASRFAVAPSRRPFDESALTRPKTAPTGIIIFIRRANDHGAVKVLEREWQVDADWANRLLRVEVDLTRREVRFFRLRKSEPHRHVLVKRAKYDPLNFHDEKL